MTKVLTKVKVHTAHHPHLTLLFTSSDLSMWGWGYSFYSRQPSFQFSLHFFESFDCAIKCTELFIVTPVLNSCTRRSCLIKSLEFLILLFLIKYPMIYDKGWPKTPKQCYLFIIIIRGNFPPSKTFQGLANITCNEVSSDQYFRQDFPEQGHREIITFNFFYLIK